MRPSLPARLLFCLVLLLPAAAIARPALWVVKDTDTTIYLFGTVHLLPNDTAWHYPAAYGWETAGIDADFEGDARRILAGALTAVTGPEPDTPVLSLVTEGYPADVLLHAAKGADLLVLGRRGHGGVTSALLGSVSLHCVLHAHCPVLVLREPT